MLSLPLDRCKVTGQGSRFLLAYNAIKTAQFENLGELVKIPIFVG